MKIIEQTARASYGKLLAILVKITDGDIALAEDCLSAAFAKALETWAESKVPENPEAWLVTTAKNQLLDGLRHKQVKATNEADLIDHLIESQTTSTTFDYRLELLFVCSHPAIDSNIRTALMLQTVMGFKVSEIAPLFLLSPLTLEKRLTRAKQKIKLAQIPFAKPDISEMPGRISEVLEVIYGVFGRSWDLLNEPLEEEALFLARLVTELLPNEPEPKGLLSLLLFCRSRQRARRLDSVYVPLDEQDTRLWDNELIAEAENLLKQAFLINKHGRFQYEAALQSAQLAKILNNADTDRDVIALYEKLQALTNAVGVSVSFAAALLRMSRIEQAHSILADLEKTESVAIRSYQPYWVLMAEMSLKLKENDSAKKYLQTALGLTEDLTVKSFLLNKMKNIERTRP